MSNFSGRIGTQQDNKTRLPKGISSELRNLLVDYMPYDEKDDMIHFAHDLLKKSRFGEFFDRFEFDESNIQYFKEKNERIESERFNDFLVNTFVQNKEHKCVVDDLEKKFPEVRKRYQKTLVARIDLGVRVARMIVHGLKDNDDYILLYLILSGKIDLNSISLLVGALLTRQNISEWKHTLEYELFTQIIKQSNQGVLTVDDYRLLYNLPDRHIHVLLEGQIGKGVYNPTWVGGQAMDTKVPFLSVFTFGRLKTQDSVRNLSEDDIRDIIRKFKDELLNIINGRGLFNPRSYFLTRMTLFNYNVAMNVNDSNGLYHVRYPNPFKEGNYINLDKQTVTVGQFGIEGRRQENEDLLPRLEGTSYVRTI